MEKIYKTKVYKTILYFGFGAIFIVVSALLFVYTQKVEVYKTAKLADSMNEAVRAENRAQIESLASLSLAISQNGVLAKAIEEGDREGAFAIVDKVLSSFEDYSSKERLRVQIHDKDMKVFMRSWDKNVYGVSLEGFRKGVLYVKNTKKAYASVELGKKLNFKAIAPIFFEGRYIGSLEVIKNFDDAVDTFKRHNAALLVLMDESHLKTAEWMVDYPRLNGYVLCHKNFDSKLVEKLKGYDINTLVGEKSAMLDGYFLSFEPLRDIDGKRIGFFVSAISEKNADIAIRSSDDSLSLLLPAPKEEILSGYKSRFSSADAEFRERYEKSEEKAAKAKKMSREELERAFVYGANSEIKTGEVR